MCSRKWVYVWGLHAFQSVSYLRLLCRIAHTILKRLWERAFGRNFNREGKKIKRTRESKTQHTYVHVNASYQLKELFLDSVAVWQQRISWCSGFYLNFTVKPKPMKKQQGGILEITGPVIAGINTEEQKKQRNQWCEKDTKTGRERRKSRSCPITANWCTQVSSFKWQISLKKIIKSADCLINSLIVWMYKVFMWLFLNTSFSQICNIQIN